MRSRPSAGAALVIVASGIYREDYLRWQLFSAADNLTKASDQVATLELGRIAMLFQSPAAKDQVVSMFAFVAKVRPNSSAVLLQFVPTLKQLRELLVACAFKPGSDDLHRLN